MYRKERLGDIAMADDVRDPDPSQISTRVPAGTVNFAAVLSIPKAVEFHFAVGAAAKEAHLRSLRNRWVHAVADLPNVEICVPDDPARYCTITSFRLKGMDTAAKAQAVQARLFEKYRVHTVWRSGVAKGAGDPRNARPLHHRAGCRRAGQGPARRTCHVGLERDRGGLRLVKFCPHHFGQSGCNRAHVDLAQIAALGNARAGDDEG
jgi:hypothetical protein